MRLIDAEKLVDMLYDNEFAVLCPLDEVSGVVDACPTVDAVPAVRCKDCISAEPLERNCEVNTSFYMHCRLWRGKECKNVWHKYKRYYRDYSLVQHDDFCSSGERKDGDTDGS